MRINIAFDFNSNDGNKKTAVHGQLFLISFTQLANSINWRKVVSQTSVFSKR